MGDRRLGNAGSGGVRLKQVRVKRKSHEYVRRVHLDGGGRAEAAEPARESAGGSGERQQRQRGERGGGGGVRRNGGRRRVGVGCAVLRAGVMAESPGRTARDVRN